MLCVELQGHIMRNIPFSAMDARYEVPVHSESSKSSIKCVHNDYTVSIYWLFVEHNALKWSVRSRVRTF